MKIEIVKSEDSPTRSRTKWGPLWAALENTKPGETVKVAGLDGPAVNSLRSSARVRRIHLSSRAQGDGTYTIWLTKKEEA